MLTRVADMFAFPMMQVVAEIIDMLISVPRSEDFGSINQVLSGCDRSVYLRSVLRVQVNTCDMDYTRVILRKKLTPVFDLTQCVEHSLVFIECLS